MDRHKLVRKHALQSDNRSSAACSNRLDLNRALGIAFVRCRLLESSFVVRRNQSLVRMLGPHAVENVVAELVGISYSEPRLSDGGFVIVLSA